MAEVFTSKQKFGFGLMRLPLTNPDDGGSIDLEETKKMVDTFLEKGFTYFDTRRSSPERQFHPGRQAACRISENKRRPRCDFQRADEKNRCYVF